MIVHFTLYKPHRFRGAGISKFIYWLTFFQAKTGHKVEVYYFSRNDDYEVPKGVKIVRLKKPIFRFFFSIRLILKLYRNKPNLAILHGSFLPEMWSVHIILKIMNIPYIVIPHGSLSSFVMKKDDVLIKKIYTKLFEFPMLKYSNFIFRTVCSKGSSAYSSSHSKIGS